MKSKSTFLLAIVFILASCTSKKPDVIVTIHTNSVINQMRGGFGANVHAIEKSMVIKDTIFAGSAYGANPELADTNGWNQVFKHLDYLGFDWVRLELQMKMYEPEKNKFTFESYDMQLLYKYLDYFEKNNADVFLQQMWHNVEWLTPDSFKTDPIKLIRSAPNDIEAFTDGLTKLMDHLINVKKYSCIKYLCINNEPYANWSWWMLQYNPPKFGSIAEALKSLRGKLDNSHINIPLSGPDASWYRDHPVTPASIDHAQYLGSFDMHSYVTRFDWWTKPFEYRLDRIIETEDSVKSWTKFAHAQDNPFFFSELGTFMLGFMGDNPNPSSFTALLKDLQLVIRFSNLGVDAFNRWSFINYGNIDGNWQLIDTWDKKQKQILKKINPHPNSYYMWGLLTRFTPKNAQVLKVDVSGGKDSLQRVFAVAYRSSTNKNYSVFITNDSESEYSAMIDLKLNPGQKIYFYELNEAKHSEKSDYELVPLETIIPDKDFNIRLTAKSIILLTTYSLADGDKGIVID